MDTDLRSLAVRIVGWSMAAFGFFLSVTVPVITSVVPLLEPRMPEELQERLRRRIEPHVVNHEGNQNSSLASPRAVSFDSSCTNSSPSVCTTRSELPSPRRTTSTPTISLPNSPELRSRTLLTDKCDQTRSRIVQHVCTPQKCSTRASTSAAQENPEKVVIANGEGEVEKTQMKNTRPLRVVSWLKNPSPPSSFLQYQYTPRSSGELSRESEADRARGRSSTFADDLRGKLPKHREPRRASTLLGFKRSSKSKTGGPDEILSMAQTSTLAMSPVSSSNPTPEGRRSEPTTPSSALRNLPDVEKSAHERKRRVSYFSRLTRKGTRKDDAKVTQGLDSVSVPDPGALASTTILPPSPRTPPSPPASDKRGRSSSRKLCRKRRRPTTAPALPSPPHRTNPYDAPYYFPTPVSPDAVDYVRLAKTEIGKRSVSPSVVRANATVKTSRIPFRDDDLGSQPASSSNVVPTIVRNSVVPQSAPPQRTSFTVASRDPALVGREHHHEKFASVSSSGTSSTVDAFGFVQPPVLGPILDQPGQCQP